MVSYIWGLRSIQVSLISCPPFDPPLRQRLTQYPIIIPVQRGRNKKGYTKGHSYATLWMNLNELISTFQLWEYVGKHIWKTLFMCIFFKSFDRNILCQSYICESLYCTNACVHLCDCIQDVKLKLGNPSWESNLEIFYPSTLYHPFTQ